MTVFTTLRTRSLSLAAAAVSFAGALAAVVALSGEAPATPPAAQHYRVTITNVTRGQIFSPAVVVAHSDAASLFTLGAPASAGLAQLAEEGDPSTLVAMMTANPEVTDVSVDEGGALLPGQTTTVMVRATPTDLISVAGMLVSTNDAFYAVAGAPTPQYGGAAHRASAYDAGSEANSEDCAYVPGPPCGSGGSHDPAESEGYVHVHAGIHGIGSLDAAQLDWRGPVAAVRIERL